MPGIDPIAEERQGDERVIAEMRTWTPARRAAVACNLTAMVRASSRAAFRRLHPERTARASDLAWAEAQYGPEIGDALRGWYATHP
jgi:hypothetical protein